MAGFGVASEAPPVPVPEGVTPGKRSALKQDTTDYAGTTIHVTWGKEHVQPQRFQGMDVGPYAMDVVVLEGETPLDAKRRAMRWLNEMAEEEYRQKLPAFVERCRKVANQL